MDSGGTIGARPAARENLELAGAIMGAHAKSMRAWLNASFGQRGCEWDAAPDDGADQVAADGIRDA